jgi:hypothetical protein
MNEQERARLSVRFFLDRLRLQIAAYRAERFPGDKDGPDIWLDLGDGILDTASAYLDKAETAIEAEALKLTREAASLCAVTYDHLSNLEGATAHHIPWAVVEPLTRWFEELKIANTIFFRAEVERNYEIKPFPETDFSRYRDPAPSLIKAISKARWPIFRVTVPSAALSILPHFAIVAHEVGHKLAVKLNPVHLAPIVLAATARIQTQLGTALDADTTQYFQTVIQKWVAEFTSDAVAYFLTGPAAFFALDFTQLVAMGHHGASHSHPAHEVRRSAIFRNLIKGNPSYATVFKAETQADLTADMGSSLLAPAPDKKTLQTDIQSRYGKPKLAIVIAELHEAAPQLADCIYNDVESHLKSVAPLSIYSPSQYQADLKCHFKALILTIPPIEAGDAIASKTPAGFASILNVGWAVVHTQIDNLKIRDDPDHPKTAKLAALHDLILKAVELSEAKRRWEKTN